MPDISETLSKHLFWDVDATSMHWERDAAFIIHRVIELGKQEDWEAIKLQYGKETIKKQVVKFRTLDDVSLSFVSTIFELKLEEFRCYRLKQSNPNSWNY